MTKYHITRNNTVGVCTAQGACPLGGGIVHFNDPVEAEEALQIRLSATAIDNTLNPVNIKELSAKQLLQYQDALEQMLSRRGIEYDKLRNGSERYEQTYQELYQQAVEEIRNTNYSQKYAEFMSKYSNRFHEGLAASKYRNIQTPINEYVVRYSLGEHKGQFKKVIERKDMEWVAIYQEHPELIEGDMKLLNNKLRTFKKKREKIANYMTLPPEVTAAELAHKRTREKLGAEPDNEDNMKAIDSYMTDLKGRLATAREEYELRTKLYEVGMRKPLTLRTSSAGLRPKRTFLDFSGKSFISLPELSTDKRANINNLYIARNGKVWRVISVLGPEVTNNMLDSNFHEHCVYRQDGEKPVDYEIFVEEPHGEEYKGYRRIDCLHFAAKKSS